MAGDDSKVMVDGFSLKPRLRFYAPALYQSFSNQIIAVTLSPETFGIHFSGSQ